LICTKGATLRWCCCGSVQVNGVESVGEGQLVLFEREGVS
jgi:hypothetical protein